MGDENENKLYVWLSEEKPTYEKEQDEVARVYHAFGLNMYQGERGDCVLIIV